jgi:heterodisulfide reductase subunit C
MVLLGERDDALNNLLVWQCVACYTCGTRCPNNIQTARITETLKQMSKESLIKPMTPKVGSFHDAFTKSVSHFGRLSELEFMGLYEMKNAASELKQGRWKAILDEIMDQAKLGLSMIKKRRMHFSIEKIKGLSEVKGLYRKSKDQGL